MDELADELRVRLEICAGGRRGAACVQDIQPLNQEVGKVVLHHFCDNTVRCLPSWRNAAHSALGRASRIVAQLARVYANLEFEMQPAGYWTR